MNVDGFRADVLREPETLAALADAYLRAGGPLDGADGRLERAAPRPLHRHGQLALRRPQRGALAAGGRRRRARRVRLGHPRAAARRPTRCASRSRPPARRRRPSPRWSATPGPARRSRSPTTPSARWATPPTSRCRCWPARRSAASPAPATSARWPCCCCSRRASPARRRPRPSCGPRSRPARHLRDTRAAWLPTGRRAARRRRRDRRHRPRRPHRRGRAVGAHAARGAARPRRGLRDRRLAARRRLPLAPPRLPRAAAGRARRYDAGVMDWARKRDSTIVAVGPPGRRQPARRHVPAAPTSRWSRC